MASTHAPDADSAVQRAAGPRHRALIAGLATCTAVLLAVGLAPAAGLGGLPGPWHRSPGPAPTDVADREGCSTAPAPATTATTATAAAPSAASLSQTLTVVVPPIVRVLDASGPTVTVRTNAARPPALGDQVWVRQADDSYVAADAAMVQRVLAARWSDAPWCSTTAEHTSIG